jgi:hypothetical protein
VISPFLTFGCCVLWHSLAAAPLEPASGPRRSLGASPSTTAGTAEVQRGREGAGGFPFAGSPGEADVTSLQEPRPPRPFDAAEMERETRGFVDIREFGATGEGAADDTAAVSSAYRALGAGGGTIFFPKGEYLFNITVAKDGVFLRGAGPGGAPGVGTRFRPWNKAQPVVQFGDGITKIKYGGLSHLTLVGDRSARTGDGLVVFGAWHLDFEDLAVFAFGRDNIRITSSASVATSFIHFRKLTSHEGRGTSLKVVNGEQWTTAVYVDHASVTDSVAAGARALHLENASITVSNTYFDVHGGHGLFMTGNNPRPRVWMNGCVIDAGDASATVAEIDNVPGDITDYFDGMGRILGRVKWSNGETSRTLSGTELYGRNARLFSPIIAGEVTIGDSAGVSNGMGGPGVVRFSRALQNGIETLTWAGSAQRFPLSFKFPVQGSAGGALWRHSETGQLRMQYVGLTPTADTSGVALATFAAVPATSKTPCLPGEWSADASFLYVCSVPNRWGRVALSSW